VRIKM